MESGSPLMNFYPISKSLYIYIYINNNFLMYKFAIQITHGPSKPKLPRNILDAFFFVTNGRILIFKLEWLANGKNLI